jgi:predicted NBD/HSP70 family sugar kinase
MKDGADAVRRHPPRVPAAHRAARPAGRLVTPLQEMRREHVAAVLAALRTVPSGTQASLAAQTGLSQATVSRILAQLRLAEVVDFAGSAAGSGGRKPTLVRLNPDARLAVGIEFEDGHAVAALTNFRARLQTRVVTRALYTSADALVETAEAAFREVTKGISRARLCAVGIGAPGVVDTANGVLRVAPQLANLRDVPLAARLEERLGLPVVIASRSKAAAVGEHLFGVGRASEHLVYVWIGSGIAAGVILGDVLQLGATSAAGGLGHVVVAENGPPCDCGGFGCLQAVAAGPAIARRALELLRSGEESTIERLAGGVLDLVDAGVVVRAAVEGDALAGRVLDEAGTHLGRAVAMAVNVLNPDLVIVGGPVGEPAAPFLIPAVERELRARALSIPRAAARIVGGTLGENAGAIGAAALALDRAPALPLPAPSDD